MRRHKDSRDKSVLLVPVLLPGTTLSGCIAPLAPTQLRFVLKVSFDSFMLEPDFSKVHFLSPTSLRLS